MLGLRCNIVELVARSTLTASHIISSFAESHGIADPTKTPSNQSSTLIQTENDQLRYNALKREACIVESENGNMVASTLSMGNPISFGGINVDANNVESNDSSDGNTSNASPSPPAIQALNNPLTASLAPVLNLDDEKLLRIAERMCGLKGCVPINIKDRKWRLYCYRNCFIGRDAVHWLIAQGCATNVREAVLLGNNLMQSHIFHKVSAGPTHSANSHVTVPIGKPAVGAFHFAQLYYTFDFHPELKWPLISLPPSAYTLTKSKNNQVISSPSLFTCSQRSTLEQNFVKEYWSLLEQEIARFCKIKSNHAELDWCHIMSEMCSSALHKLRSKLSSSHNIPTPTITITSPAGNTTLTLTQPPAATNPALPPPHHNTLHPHSNMNGHTSSSSSHSHAPPHTFHHPSPHHGLPASPTDIDANNLPLLMRHTSHFLGSDIIRYLKKSHNISNVRDTMCIMTYFLRQSSFSPQLISRPPPNLYLDGSSPPLISVVGTSEQILSNRSCVEHIHSLYMAKDLYDMWHEQHHANQHANTNDESMITGARNKSPPHTQLSQAAQLRAKETLLAHQQRMNNLEAEWQTYLQNDIRLPLSFFEIFRNGDVWYHFNYSSLAAPPTPPAANDVESTPYNSSLSVTISTDNVVLPGAIESPHHGGMNGVKQLKPSNKQESLSNQLNGTSNTSNNNHNADLPPLPNISLTTSKSDEQLLPSIIRKQFQPVHSQSDTISTTASSSLLSCAPYSELNWEFVQSFGDDSSAYDFDDADDLVTAVEFNPTGEFLAIGDKAGRVSIVQEAMPNKTAPLEYKFFTEFQSHDPEFDCLKSIEIEPKINVIEWWNQISQQMILLTANDKTVKLWRIGMQPPVKKKHPSHFNLVNSSPNDVEPEDDEDMMSIGATRKQCYKNAHGYNIHSVSVNSDGQSFFSADDLRINLWHADRDDECYTIIDLKPPEMTEVDELITVAKFHPINCNLMMHGSSKGVIRLADLRQKALIDRLASQTLQIKSSTKKTYFSEITDSILDTQYSEDGQHILARDYMSLRLWDIRNSAQPIYTSHVHPQLSAHFIHLLDNESIFDQFQCAMSRDGTHFVSGTYSNCFTLHNLLTRRTQTIKARDDTREPVLVNSHYNYENGTHGSEKPKYPYPVQDDHKAPQKKEKKDKNKQPNYRKKVLKVAWHPRINALAVAGLYKLYLYQSKF